MVEFLLYSYLQNKMLYKHVVSIFAKDRILKQNQFILRST